MTASRPRSIAVYVPSLQAGGAERTAAVLASGFRAAGIPTALLVDHDAEAQDGFLDQGVERVLPLGGHGRSIMRLARWLVQEQPEAAVAIDATASLKLVLARVLSRAQTRIYLSYHGYGDIVRGRIGRLAYWLAPLLTRLSNGTVCVSEGLARHLVEDWGAKAGTVTVIPNPIPVQHARPPADAAALAARPATIIAVGRMVPEKRHADLIAALRLLPPETRLVMLGDGPARDTLVAMAADLQERVSLPGHREPWAAYEAARVFALTSTSESFGNVVVEALASGLPVVSTDCGGPREILEDGRFGSLYPVGDVQALANALEEALITPGDPAPRVARASVYATSHVVDAYLDLFERRR
ncbi:MAG: glycosyltransferase [Methylobacterium sp.]|uniref:glycosyltransferase n=1 Tax=Methylobacterium sp. TaxID=409 RepID=UPI0025E44F15|nr:glycosyltransferase [Methylobacterium sp.]MBX9930358.1 glycosyltransferase [Methylobacterium sp.]